MLTKAEWSRWFAVGATLVALSACQKEQLTGIDVNGRRLVRLEIVPQSLVLPPAGTASFTAIPVYRDSTLAPLPPLRYLATGAASIDSTTGAYLAPAAEGTYLVLVETVGSELRDTAQVTVQAAPTAVASVSVLPTTSSVNIGSTVQLAATARDASGNTLLGRAVTWSTTNAAAATVNSSGVATAVAAGNATIRATVEGQIGQASITVQTPPAPGARNMYFNSAEQGCGTDANILLCDDFERGEWYTKNCDQANASGGLLQTSGWCGTIYNNTGMAAGTARCGGVGFRSNCAATTGVLTGGTTGNMADHALSGEQGVGEIWVRFYTKPLAGYEFGAEKMLTFNDGRPGDAGIRWGNLSWNCGGLTSSTGFLTMGFPTPMDICQGQNLGNNITITPGNWYFYEVHYRLSSPGGSNGVYELWVDNCGPSGNSCPATPTLRMRRTDVRNSRANTDQLIRVLWFEAWSNPVSRGERYWDQIVASRVGPIGFMR